MASFSFGQSVPTRRSSRPITLMAIIGFVLACAGCASTTTKETTTAATRDARVNARVQAALAGDASLASQPITVRTTDGAVALEGQVDSAMQIAHAVALVRDIDGVAVLRNDLHVKSH